MANRKAIRLEGIVKRLNEWRNIEFGQEERMWRKDVLKNCYSPMCRLGVLPLQITDSSYSMQSCYSLSCRQAVAQSMERTTSGVVHAHPPSAVSKIKQENGVDEKVLGIDKPFPLPVPFDYRVRRTGEQSLLVLPQKALKRLARQGGVNLNYSAPGFHRMSKSNSQVWNYPCQRPLFDNCWRYTTLRAQSYHSIALHLRILYTCIRWGDMRRDPEEDLRVTAHLADHDEVRTVIGHKEYPPDGLYEQYKLRVEMIPLDDSIDVNEGDDELGSAAYHPGRSLERTLRKRKPTKGRTVNGALRMDKVKVVEKWIDGSELKLWEIVDYWRGIENRSRRGSATPTAVTVVNRVSTPIVRQYEPSPAYLSRMSAEKRRPQPKRMPDFDYNVKDDEDDDDDDEYDGNDDGDGDDDEFIDVETVPNVTETRPSPNFEPERKRPRLIEPKPDRRLIESPYKAQWYIPNGQHPPVYHQYDQMVRQPGELRGGGKYTVLQKPDGTLCRVMVYQNRPTLQSASSNSLPGPSMRYSPAQPVGSSLPRLGTVPREPMRIPVARRVVTVPSSSQASPATPMGKKLLLIRRSDGTTQYLRPVNQPPGGTSAAGVYRTIRATQAGGATISDIQGASNVSSVARQGVTTRTVFSGNQSMARVVRLPTRTVTVINQPSVSGAPPLEPSPMRIARMQSADFSRVERQTSVTHDYAAQTSVRRGMTGDEVLHDSYTGASSAQEDEEYRLLAERGLRPPGRPPVRTFNLGNGRIVSTARPAVTVQPRQSLSAVAHCPIEQQSSSGQIFGDHDPMIGATSRYPSLVRTGGARTGIAVRTRIGAELGQMEHHNPASTLYGRAHTSRLNDLADAASVVGHNYVTRRMSMNHIGTVDIRSNLYIRPFELPEQRAIKEILDDLITEVCIMDVEKGWHRRHIQRIFERRNEERKRREMEQRELKMQRLSARQLEAELGPGAPYTVTNAELQSIASMPVEPSTISLGNISQPTIPSSSDLNRGAEAGSIRLPICTDENYSKSTGLIPNLSDEKPPPPLPPSQIATNQPFVETRVKLEESSPQRRSERSKKKKIWDEGFVTNERARSTSRMSSGSETLTASKQSGKSRKERRSTTAGGTTPSTSSKVESASSGPIPDIDTTKRHCKCNQPYDSKKFYVGCDLCYRWFHGRCVGISEKKSKKMTSWVCEDCTKEQKNSEQELYCVCRTPYDDSRFYVGCDGCEGWFHPQCVGITQEEAEKAAEYLCPQCVRSRQGGYESSTSSTSQTTLSRTDFALLWQVLDNLKDHRTSWPFREAVDPEEHPDYYSVIKKPMDLSIVQRKLERCEYHRLKDFTADITQIFENARTYNPKDSAIYQCADILEKQFRERILQTKVEMEMRNKEQATSSGDNRTLDSSLDIDTDQLINVTDDLDPATLDLFS